MYSIRNDKLSDRERVQIQDDLLFIPNKHKQTRGGGKGKGSFTPKLVAFPVFDVSRDGTHTQVPRPYGWSTLGPPAVDASVMGDRMQYGLAFKGELRSSDAYPQQQAAAAIAKHWASAERGEREGSCMVCLGTGAGKTVIGSYSAVMRGRKTIILVPKEFLLEQWKATLERFFPGTRVGRIHAKNIDVHDKDVVLAMIPTLINKPIDRERAERFALKSYGTVVADESHHLAAASFHKVACMFPARYKLYLTATPDRDDGLVKELRWLTGNIIFRAVTPTMVPTIHIVRTTIPSSLAKSMWRRGGASLSWAASLTNMTQHGPRNAILLGLIQGQVAEGHRVVCLTDRVEHVKLVRDGLDEVGITCGAIMQGASKEAREAAGEAQVVAATYMMLQEGWDCPWFDTLVLATPHGGHTLLTQSIGRVTRQHAGKTAATVYDLVDELETTTGPAADELSGMLVGMFTKRKRLYAAMKYPVKFGRGNGGLWGGEAVVGNESDGGGDVDFCFE